MKRTKSINLSRMRKQNPVLKPATLLISATAIAACESQTSAKVYRDVTHCTLDTGQEERCEAAYEEALRVAQTSGPKYRSMYDCVSDFGNNNCMEYQPPGTPLRYIPRVTGFMLQEDERQRSAPLFTSFNRYSPYYGRWSTVDGRDVGRNRYGDISVGASSFDSKPAVTRTTSRGGFGSRASFSSGSSWGG